MIGAASLRREVAMPDDRASRLYDLARRVERLTPSHREPGRFEEDKQEISVELTKLGDEAQRWPLA